MWCFQLRFLCLLFLFSFFLPLFLSSTRFNPLNAKLNPICHLLALLGAHHILHISRIRVKVLYVVTPMTSGSLCSLFAISKNRLFVTCQHVSVQFSMYEVTLL